MSCNLQSGFVKRVERFSGLWLQPRSVCPGVMQLMLANVGESPIQIQIHMEMKKQGNYHLLAIGDVNEKNEHVVHIYGARSRNKNRPQNK